MEWSNGLGLLAQAYESFALWCYQHQTATDLIAVSVILWGVAQLCKKQRRDRRRLHRILRGMRMKNAERRLLQQARFEDALLDAAMEMVIRGEMTEAQGKCWDRDFADKMGFTGMVPRKTQHSIKRGIKLRLRRMTHPRIPGPKPGVKVDKSYAPPTKMVSKYARKEKENGEQQ